LRKKRIAFPSFFVVIARLARATHLLVKKKLGRPHKAGDDGGMDER
jgi:hypothetical protein